MRWLLSRLRRENDPRLPHTCFVALFAPKSLSEPCDCSHTCKWSPHEGAQACRLPVLEEGDEVAAVAVFRKRYVSLTESPPLAGNEVVGAEAEAAG